MGRGVPCIPGLQTPLRVTVPGALESDHACPRGGGEGRPPSHQTGFLTMSLLSSLSPGSTLLCPRPFGSHRWGWASGLPGDSTCQGLVTK